MGENHTIEPHREPRNLSAVGLQKRMKKKDLKINQLDIQADSKKRGNRHP